MFRKGCSKPGKTKNRAEEQSFFKKLILVILADLQSSKSNEAAFLVRILCIECISMDMLQIGPLVLVGRLAEAQRTILDISSRRIFCNIPDYIDGMAVYKYIAILCKIIWMWCDGDIYSKALGKDVQIAGTRFTETFGPI